VGHAAPAVLFSQNGLDDALVAVEDATQYQQAGSEPKLVRWCPGGHFLNAAATSERILWLQEQITEAACLNVGQFVEDDIQ
jgi:surfactin synthase thioesterase subunit